MVFCKKQNTVELCKIVDNLNVLDNKVVLLVNYEDISQHFSCNITAFLSNIYIYIYLCLCMNICKQYFICLDFILKYILYKR